MKTAVEKLKDDRVKLTVDLSAKEVDERIAATYKDFAYKYNFPGFRKGKAPRPVIDNAVGAEAVCATVTGDIVEELYPRAMDENDLVAIGQPETETDPELVEAGKKFSFTSTVLCTPEFELSDYGPVTIELPDAAATDEEIDAQIDEMCEYFQDFEDCAASTKVAKDSFVEIALKANGSDGAAIDALSTEKRMYQLGTGLFPDAFDKGLLGMKKGESKTIEVKMDGDDSAMAQGMPGMDTITFDVEVLQVKKKMTPKITDEWVKKNAGFDSVDELRKRVAENITQQKEGMLPQMRETETLYALAERLKGEAPDAMCEAEEQNLLQNFFRQVNEQNISFDAYLQQMGLTPQQFQEDLKKQARDVTEQDLALDAWARHAKIEITGKQITEEFVKSGVEDARGLEKEWRESGRMSMLRQGMRRTEALKAILEDVVVKPLSDKKKPAAKKTTAKKPAAKKTAEKKPAAKKTTAKKPAAKKAAE